ncbi:MAG TPA: hypothetical protein VGR37_10365 [Longimicrobiaceae bacterium]|nr:hypothetical protein [Longimicrobiaceae bacterium]
MRRAPPVLLALLVIYGFLSPPAPRAQEPAERPPIQRQAQGFRLEQNDPNPFTRDTYIPFYLEENLFPGGEPRLVTMQVFNLLNQLVAVPRAPDHPRGKNLPVQNLPYSEAGRKVAYWDGRDTKGRRVPPGVYYCQLVVTGQQPQMRKMIVTSPQRRSRIPIPWFGRERSRSE